MMRRLAVAALLLISWQTMYAADSTSVVQVTTLYSSVNPIPVLNTAGTFRDVFLGLGGKTLYFPIFFDQSTIRTIQLAVRFGSYASASTVYRVELRNSDSSKVVPITFTSSGAVDTTLFSAAVSFNSSTRDTFKLYAKASTQYASIRIYWAAFYQRDYLTTLSTIDSTGFFATDYDVSLKAAKSDTSVFISTISDLKDTASSIRTSIALKAAKLDTTTFISSISDLKDTSVAIRAWSTTRLDRLSDSLQDAYDTGLGGGGASDTLGGLFFDTTGQANVEHIAVPTHYADSTDYEITDLIPFPTPPTTGTWQLFATADSVTKRKPVLRLVIRFGQTSGTALTTGTGKGVIDAPDAFTIDSVKGFVLQKGAGRCVFDINSEEGVSVLGTPKLTIPTGVSRNTVLPAIQFPNVVMPNYFTVDIDTIAASAYGGQVTIFGHTD